MLHFYGAFIFVFKLIKIFDSHIDRYKFLRLSVMLFSRSSVCLYSLSISSHAP